jgi:hypothetical protein
MIVKKIAVESAGLLEKEVLEEFIIGSFKTSNTIIQETAFRSARNIRSFSRRMERAMTAYLLSFDMIEFFERKKELLFSLQLSPAFRRSLTVARIININHYLFTIGLIILFTNWGTTLTFLTVVGLVVPLNYVAYLTTLPGITHYDPKQDNSVSKKGSVELFTMEISLPIKIPMILCCRLVFSILAYLIVSSYYNIHPPIVSAIYTVAVIITFPFLDIYLSLKAIGLSKEYLILLLLPLGVVPIIGLIYLLGRLFPHVNLNPFFTQFFIWVPRLIGGWLVTVFPFLLIKNYLADKKLLRSIQFFEEMEREKISDYFNAFTYKRHRLTFVKDLEAKVKKVTGHWPDNVLPNADNDYPSILLMQLDEKWLGLAR